MNREHGKFIFISPVLSMYLPFSLFSVRLSTIFLFAPEPQRCGLKDMKVRHNGQLGLQEDTFSLHVTPLYLFLAFKSTLFSHFYSHSQPINCSAVASLTYKCYVISESIIRPCSGQKVSINIIIIFGVTCKRYLLLPSKRLRPNLTDDG